MDLTGYVRASGDQQETATAGLGDRDEKGGVGLLVQDGVAGRVVPQAMRPYAERPQAVVELDVEQRPAVLRPLDRARGIADEVRQLVAGFQVAQVKAVALRTVLVGH